MEITLTINFFDDLVIATDYKKAHGRVWRVGNVLHIDQRCLYCEFQTIRRLLAYVTEVKKTFGVSEIVFHVRTGGNFILHEYSEDEVDARWPEVGQSCLGIPLLQWAGLSYDFPEYSSYRLAE